MPRANRTVLMLSDQEEAGLQRSIANDSENPELTDGQLAAMRPAAEVLTPALYSALARPRGRPKAEITKTPVKLRLDEEIVGYYKKRGPGWQTDMNNFLRATDGVQEMMKQQMALIKSSEKLVGTLKRGGLQKFGEPITKTIEKVVKEIDRAKVMLDAVNKQLQR